MADMRQETHHIDAGLEREHRRRGEYLTWYEFINVVAADLDPVYDYGSYGSTSGMRYNAGVQVPVFNLIEREDMRSPRPEGRLTYQVLTFSMSYHALLRAGLGQVWENRVHIRDIVYVDGRYYKLYRFEDQGRMQDAEVMVTCAGTETYIDQEDGFDPGPTLPHNDLLLFPGTFPSLTAAGATAGTTSPSQGGVHPLVGRQTGRRPVTRPRSH